MPNPFDVFDNVGVASNGNPFDVFDSQQNPFDAFDSVGVDDRQRPPSFEGMQGTEKANISPVGVLETPLVGIGMLASGLGNLAAKALGYGPRPVLSEQNFTTPPMFEVGKPLVTSEFANEDIDPVNKVLGNVLRSFTTPESIATLGLSGALKAPKLAAGLFGGAMAEHAPESTRQAAQKTGAYVGTPVEQRTEQMKFEAQEAVLNDVLNKAFLAAIASGFRRGSQPLEPEILPPKTRTAPPSRQIEGPVIDVESYKLSNQLPGPRGEFVVDEVGRVLDKSTLTEAEFREFNRGPKVYRPPSKKTYEGEVPIVGEINPQQKLAVDIAKAFEEYKKQQESLIQPQSAVVGGKESQGGQISFSSPAGGYTIPSARQSAIQKPEPLFSGVESRRLLGIGDDAASQAQGAKMIRGGIEDSRQAGKAPQIEDAISGEKPLNPGGALKDLPPELQAKSNAVKDAMAAEFEKVKQRQKELDAEKAKKGKVYGGMFFLDPDFWSSQLGIAKQAKTDAVQIYNRMRNKLGEKSAAWEMLDTAEFKNFMQGVKSPQEVEKWVEENGPKVEVRKFGEVGQTPEQKELSELIHWSDSLSGPQRLYVDTLYKGHEAAVTEMQRAWPGSPIPPKEIQTKANRVLELRKANQFDISGQEAHWSSIAPKPESAMPGYVEIAVVKPVKRESKTQAQYFQEQQLQDTSETREWYQDYVNQGGIPKEQFPSSHSFPPNTLGFGRGYMESGANLKKFNPGKYDHIPDDAKVALLVEGQSDWAQELRDLKTSQDFARARGDELGERTPAQSASYLQKVKRLEDPLLSQYERLILKSWIEHAREQGAEYIAVIDAESAMMMEGHDRALYSYIDPTPHNIEVAKRYNTPISKKVLETLQKGESYESGTSQPFERSEEHQKVVDAEDAGFQLIQRPRQQEGMRLHYNRTLQKIAEELTGSKGEKVSFGEHKMAFEPEQRLQTATEQDRLAYNELYRQLEAGEINEQQFAIAVENIEGVTFNYPRSKQRKDLIFRNPDGTPKTDVSGFVYPLDKVKENFTYTGSDKPAKPQAKIERPTGKESEVIHVLNNALTVVKNLASTGDFSKGMTDVLMARGDEIFAQAQKDPQDALVAAKKFRQDVKEITAAKGKGIGSGIQKAIEKNKEAGAIVNPFKKMNRPIDSTQFQKVQKFYDYAREVKDATTPQGIGKVPGLARLFDPRSYKTEPFQKAVITNQVMGIKGQNMAALWLEAQKDVQRSFQGLPMSDIIEAEMRSPGSQKLTPGQKDFIKNWTELRAKLVNEAQAEGVKYFVDDNGNPIPINEFYFPRPAIGKVGVKESVKDTIRRSVGGKQFFQSGRDFKTEAEGVAKGIKYDPDEFSRVGRFMSGMYKAIADTRFANDPALQGRPVSQGGPHFLTEGMVMQPAFQGRVFPLEMAKKLNRFYGETTHDWVRSLSDFNDFLKAFQFAFDVSAPMNQGLPLMGVNPARWAKATVKSYQALLDDRVLTKYLRDKENSRVARLIVANGGTIGRLQDFLAGVEKGKVAERIAPLRASARSMGTFLSIAKIELFKAFEKSMPKASEAELVEAVENAVLSGKMEGLGLQRGRALGERLVFNAPSYIRGAVNIVAQAAQGGISGKVARRALIGMMTAIALQMYVLYKLKGMKDEEIKDRFDPRNPEFMRFPHEMSNGRVKEFSYGNILISMARVAGDTVEVAQGTKKVESGVQGNPWLRWLSYRGSPGAQLGAKLYTGEDYRGEPITAKEAAMRSVLPISADPISREGFNQSGLVGSGAQFLGLSTFDESPGAFRNRQQDLLGQEKFGKDYKRLSFGERRQVTDEAQNRMKKLGEKVSPRQIMNIQKAGQQRQQEVVEGLSEPIQQWLTDKQLRVAGYQETISLGGKSIRLADQEERDLLKERMIFHTEKMLTPLAESNRSISQETLDIRVEMAHRRAWSDIRRSLSRQDIKYP